MKQEGQKGLKEGPSKWSEEFIRRVWWMSLVRVVVLTLLIGAIYLFFRSLKLNTVLWPLPLVLLATYLVTAFVWFGVKIGVKKGTGIVHLMYSQLIWDIFVITEIVYYTGGIDSPLIPLYFLAIFGASLFLGLKGSILIAGQSSLVYGLLIWTEFKGIIPEMFFAGQLSSSTYQFQAVLINIYLYISFFFLSAFISGYLAERLRLKGEELQTTSNMLKRMRLDTDNIMKNMSGGLITVDYEGRIVYFNKAAEHILSYREGDVKGKYCQEVFAQRMPDLGRMMMETLEQGIIHSRREITVKCGLVKMKPIGLTTALVQDEQGRRGGVIVNFQDLTDVKRMEQMMRRADRLAAVGELSAGIAHEIRNPLASISGAVEVLREAVPVSGENEKLMTLIVRESERLNKIIKGFLDFSRLKLPTATKVSLNDVVDEVFSLIENHPSNNKNITVLNEIGVQAISVQFDEDQLKQLLINLLVNGLEAMPEGGELKIGVHSSNGSGSSRDSGDDVRIFVSDTGVGVEEKDRDRIFEPFVSTKKSGTGLGLSIVQRILEHNKGRIEIENNREQGVTFLVSLPRCC
ncbi:MAG: PAS domain S-box protein [Gemmatimonadota bacterium]|nr:MAG: PAS domain S-box protein [Gemmatimonadota bacterium]